MILGLSVLFGLLESWQGRFLYPNIPWQKFWPVALFRAMPSWIILAALMPGVIGLCRAMRLDRPRRSLALAAHIAGGLLFVVLHLGGTSWVGTLEGVAFRDQMLFLLYHYAVNDFFIYSALIGAIHVILHQSELRVREVAESDLRARLAEARLGALRAQLNPHFLFNTLNAMSTLAMRGESERLVQAIDALCTLLRAAIDDRRGAWSTLATEMEFLDRLIEIQELRFGDRLEVERDVPGDVAVALVPSLLLQPLVENAVEHGVARRVGAGRVSIRAARENGELRIEIADTGPGFAADATSPHEGVGLANTRARLAELFGAGASLVCVNRPEGGARVTVRMPWLESSPENGAPNPREAPR